MKKVAKKRAPPTEPVTIRLPVEIVRQYEALAAARLMSRSKYMELVLEDRVPADDSDHALISLCRIIAIHEEVQRQGIGIELISELHALVSILSRAVRGSCVE